MITRPYFFLILLLVAAAGAACAGREGNTNAAIANPVAEDTPRPAVTPSDGITEADIAKLKWLEGTWRGMDGQKPFYERIRFEGTTMIVETFADGTLSKVNDTARFELKDGEFGHTAGEQRSAASAITESSVQFVPDSVRPDAAQKGNTFRFERQPDGKWRAILEVPASQNRPASEKIYIMEPWKPQAERS